MACTAHQEYPDRRRPFPDPLDHAVNRLSHQMDVCDEQVKRGLGQDSVQLFHIHGAENAVADFQKGTFDSSQYQGLIINNKDFLKHGFTCHVLTAPLMPVLTGPATEIGLNKGDNLFMLRGPAAGDLQRLPEADMDCFR